MAVSIGVAGLGISAASSIGNSLTSSGAAGSESASIAAGQAAAAKALSPYTTTGGSAETALGNLSGANGTAAQNTAFSSFQASPQYAYQEKQGLTAIDQGAAAKGMVQSGATSQAEQSFGSDLANQSFQSYYNNLSGLATTGAQAAENLAQTYTSGATAQAGITANDARAQNTSLNSGLSGLATTVNNPSVTSSLASLVSPDATPNFSSAGSTASAGF